ncbi:hypothetical protein ABE82_26715 (plasmid) [Paenibacillus peoriae]|uniref:hypothetical protein n=1 Tax=Paenibacillus peoriae TaxID=59893 RepID=UPI000720472B|nr:hypothetical protein [Paenibacillus peoriae]ALS10005.1 hypothetical protein ABE82_26715 [Paenibacillus peoriae]
MTVKKADLRDNGMINVPDIKIEYRGFMIQAKLDMGSCPWRINGNDIRRGYIVVKDGALALPGAAWAHSVIEAKTLIDIYLAAGQDGQTFWQLLSKAQGYEEYEKV